MQSQSNSIATTITFLPLFPVNRQSQPNNITPMFPFPFQFTRSTVEIMDYTITIENQRTDNASINVIEMDWKPESAVNKDALEIDEDEDEEAMEIDEEEDEEIDPDI